MNTTIARLILPTISLTASAPAAIIGVNFGTTGFNNLTSADLAGVPGFAQTHWLNLTSAATAQPLSDATGNPTSALLTTSGASFSVINGEVHDPDEILNSQRANSAGTWSFSVSSIPYSFYSIIVYDLDIVLGTVKGINVGPTTFYTSSPASTGPGYLDGNSTTPYIYTRGTSTDPALPTPLSDYVQFDGLSGANQTVTINNISGSARVGGFQIVQTPEPGTCGLLIGAFGGLGMRRFRGRRG